MLTTAAIQPPTTATKEALMMGRAAVRLPMPSSRAWVIQAPPDLPTCEPDKSWHGDMQQQADVQLDSSSDLGLGEAVQM